MNILGIDFEDWYHPELIRKNITLDEKIEPSVIQGIDKIIDWLRKNETLATFFVVGELLEFKPEIFDKIIENGHEIGFHTMHHTKLDNIESKEKFTDEIKKFEQLTKKKSKGFMAPTFSLNQKTSWAIDVLQENNYLCHCYTSPHLISIEERFIIANKEITKQKLLNTINKIKKINSDKPITFFEFTTAVAFYLFAKEKALSISFSFLTSFIPFPPPPADALIKIG